MTNETKNWHIVAVRRLSDAQLTALSEVAEVSYFQDLNSSNRAEFLTALSQAHGLIGGKLELSEAELAEAPALQVVSTISVGYDHLPLEALNRRGILLCNTPDVLTDTTADTAFALIMATQRRLVELANLVRNGDWRAHIGTEHFGVDVHSKTLGIVGAGRIGAAIARRGALGFDMPIRYTASSSKPALEHSLGAQRRDLAELLAEADIVCISVPYSDDTHHLIDANALAQMKPTASLINIARGNVVDELALIEALRSGRLRAAGLDVFAVEPLPADSPLTTMDNVVTTPHIGSATHETRELMAQLAVENLLGALTGSGPYNAVNEDVWRRAADAKEE